MFPKCLLQLLCVNQDSIKIHTLHTYISLTSPFLLFLSFLYFVYLPHGHSLSIFLMLLTCWRDLSSSHCHCWDKSLLSKNKTTTTKHILASPSSYLFFISSNLVVALDNLAVSFCHFPLTSQPIPIWILPTAVTALVKSPMTSITLNPQDTLTWLLRTFHCCTISSLNTPWLLWSPTT